MAIIIHAYYVDVFKEIIKVLGDVGIRHKIFITTVRGIETELNTIMELAKFDYEIFVYENRGRDVLPFLSVLKNIDLDSYPFVLKLHTKKSLHPERFVQVELEPAGERNGAVMPSGTSGSSKSSCSPT